VADGREVGLGDVGLGEAGGGATGHIEQVAGGGLRQAEVLSDLEGCGAGGPTVCLLSTEVRSCDGRCRGLREQGGGAAGPEGVSRQVPHQLAPLQSRQRHADSRRAGCVREPHAEQVPQVAALAHRVSRRAVVGRLTERVVERVRQVAQGLRRADVGGFAADRQL
jgi:hypothetical protein